MAPNINADSLQTQDEVIDDPSILNGRILANPAPGEEVCITGNRSSTSFSSFKKFWIIFFLSSRCFWCLP